MYSTTYVRDELEKLEKKYNKKEGGGEKGTIKWLKYSIYNPEQSVNRPYVTALKMVNPNPDESIDITTESINKLTWIDGNKVTYTVSSSGVTANLQEVKPIHVLEVMKKLPTITSIFASKVDARTENIYVILPHISLEDYKVLIQRLKKKKKNGVISWLTNLQ